MRAVACVGANYSNIASLDDRAKFLRLVSDALLGALLESGTGEDDIAILVIRHVA